MEDRLDRLHTAVRGSRLLGLFAWGCRLLLALAFLPSGWTKLAGHRFTQIGIEHPIGFFFEALYRTGPYYRFIGGMQVLAAVLLLIPRTSTLGAALFLPIIANVVLVTVSLHFTGTVFITVPMLLASTFLVLWDYDRFKPLLGSPFRWGFTRASAVPAPMDSDVAAAGVLTLGTTLTVLLGGLLVLTEPQRAATPASTAVLTLAWAVSPIAAWASVLRRNRNASDPMIARRGAYLSAALLVLALAIVVAWTPAHQTASLPAVWTGAVAVLWGAVVMGTLAVWRLKPSPALAEM